MAWDFSTEPEFQKKLDWVEDFCKNEIEPLDLVFPYAVRSKDPKVDVCRIGMQFGGGGHSLAAGIRMPGPLAVARKRLMSVVSEEISTFENEAKS